MRFRRSILPGRVVAGLQAFVSTGAGAADFAIAPTRIELGPKQQAAIISISNNSPQTLHLQVETMQWTMDAEGSWNLTPTDDLIVNPQLFEIVGSSTAPLRVGTLQPADATERAYRIIIEELPGENQVLDPGTMNIRMLTHLSVPAFIEPAKAQPALSIATARIDGRQLIVKFKNNGNARLDPHQLSLRVLDNKHGEVFRNEQLFGYILAESSLALKVELPTPVCAQAKSLTVQLESQPAFPEHDITQGAGACAAKPSP